MIERGRKVERENIGPSFFTGSLVCFHVKPVRISSISDKLRTAMAQLDIRVNAWYSGSTLDCWSTGQAINPVPGA